MVALPLQHLAFAAVWRSAAPPAPQFAGELVFCPVAPVGRPFTGFEPPLQRAPPVPLIHVFGGAHPPAPPMGEHGAHAVATPT